jgi:hypothetical protein
MLDEEMEQEDSEKKTPQKSKRSRGKKEMFTFSQATIWPSSSQTVDVDNAGVFNEDEANVSKFYKTFLITFIRMLLKMHLNSCLDLIKKNLWFLLKLQNFLF